MKNLYIVLLASIVIVVIIKIQDMHTQPNEQIPNWYTYINVSVENMGNMHYRITLSEKSAFQDIDVRNGIDLTKPHMVELIDKDGYPSVLRIVGGYESDGKPWYKYWAVDVLDRDKGKFVFVADLLQ